MLKNEKIRIVRSVNNKEAAKIFCKNEKVRDEIWERKSELKEDYDMYLNKWLTIEERKGRYEVREKVKEMKEENRRKGLKIEVEVDGDRAKISGAWYKWKDGKWKGRSRKKRRRMWRMRTKLREFI